MQQRVGKPEIFAFALVVIIFPALETPRELAASRLHNRLLEPGIDCFALELDEDPFATVFDGWEPCEVTRQRRACNTDFELTFTVRCE